MLPRIQRTIEVNGHRNLWTEHDVFWHWNDAVLRNSSGKLLLNRNALQLSACEQVTLMKGWVFDNNSKDVYFREKRLNFGMGMQTPISFETNTWSQ